jgi:hypothetical protein
MMVMMIAITPSENAPSLSGPTFRALNPPSAF